MSSKTFKETRAFLHAHGLDVSPTDLPPMVEVAIREMMATLFPEDGLSDLPQAEIEVLKRGGFDTEPRRLRRKDPLARTIASYAALLETSLTTREAGERLGVNPSRIRQKLTSKPPSLYGIHADGKWRLPLFQFTAKGVVPGIEEAIANLDSDLHPVAVYHWFTAPNPDLQVDEEPLTPLDWFRSGQDPEVAARLAADI
ncbi:MAG: hypothetical protein RL885_01380 [Planctomycetota bacterium]